MRVLGKGKTALAIKDIYNNAILYDDSNLDIYDKNSIEATIVSPGIPPHNNLVKNTKNPISDYDLFLCDDNFKVNKDIFSIWISGTNGKTTTTQMCEHLLKHKDFIACGNIGLPLASAIKQKVKNLIIESSSYTLHYTSYAKPNIYILLPISPDHLSWHGDFQEYEKAKLKPLKFLNKDDIAIVPFKYSNYKTSANLITYNDSSDLANKLDINISKIKFKEPFLLDALLALSVEKLLFNCISYEKLNLFKTDEHKMEEFANINDVLYVNDSKGTNIDATIQAIKTYCSKHIYLILGGDDKGVSLEPLFNEIKKYKINIFAIGTNTDKIFEICKNNNISCIKNYNLIDASKSIKDKLLTNNGSIVVLLSPAASSYDQFDSYKQRGELFKKYIL